MSCDKNREKPLKELYLYLTEECNLNCRHCWILPKYTGKSECVEHYIDTKILIKTIDDAIAIGLQGVKLTGGEPLLHPQVKEIISFINKRNLYLVIETNGVLLTPEIADLIKCNKASMVSISIDSHIRESHEKIRGVKGCFDASVAAITLLSERGVNNQIIMSLLNENRGHIESLVALAERLGVQSVKFNIIQPTEKGEKLHEDNCIPSVEEYIRLGQYVVADLQKRVKPKLVFDLPPAFLPLHSLYGEKGMLCSCSIDAILGIVWNGNVSYCGIGQNEKELILGNVFDTPIVEIWEHEQLEPVKCSVVENLTGICADCLMKVQCKGKCLAQNYYRTKDLFSGFWFCEEADKLGIFPKSRTAL